MSRGEAERLAAALVSVGRGRLVCVTGAGVSTASGIPTFRGSDPDAVWRRYDVETATVEFFRRDPVAQWRWYLERFERTDDARPNPAHDALATLERWQEARGGTFLLVTQNIDTLHEQAGSRRLVKVHGTSDRLRCSADGCRLAAPYGSLPRADVDLAAFRARPGVETLPRCPACAAPLRAHVLFFDEYYHEHRDYRFEGVQEAAHTCDLVLFAGTSFSVGVTDLFLREAYVRGVPRLSVDPAAPRGRETGLLTVFRAPAEELLPAVCEAIGAGGPSP